MNLTVNSFNKAEKSYKMKDRLEGLRWKVFEREPDN